ncbi:hypothetical protein HNQ50_004371 [Silvimonas terrae]|uniref:Uncharacterized protein n=1 Tax=Silvimonas terrae TaxID=300266 RepID=A0A840RN67_9NEIS|nr:hypothetical protein [Silvimonas terrae]MBB5193613.1 hypothetical protein [Silvimonas terrae]
MPEFNTLIYKDFVFMRNMPTASFAGSIRPTLPPRPRYCRPTPSPIDDRPKHLFSQGLPANALPARRQTATRAVTNMPQYLTRKPQHLVYERFIKHGTAIAVKGQTRKS